MGRIDTKVDIQKDITIQAVYGEVTADEIRKSVLDYYQGEVTRMILWDFRNASLARITGEELRGLVKLTQQYSQRRSGGKTAGVFSSQADLGVGRMFEIQRGMDVNKVDHMTFSDIESAYKWLGKQQEQE